ESDLELEFRPIVSRDLGRFSVDLNPSFELPTVSRERRTLEFNYGARVYYRLSRDFVPGIEFFGDIGQIRRPDAAREQEHYVFPVLYGRLARGLKFVAGPGFGLTRASDPVLLKLGIEYEFTLAGGGGGLDEQAVAGHGADGGAQRIGVLEGDDARHGDVEAEVEVAPRVVEPAGEAVDDAAHRPGALGAQELRRLDVRLAHVHDQRQ